MKSVNDILPNEPAGMVGKYSQPEQQTGLGEEARRLVNDAFKAICAAKPAWRKAFPDDQAIKNMKASLTKALIDSGCSDYRLIKLGVKRARLDPSPFFPSTGQFVQWCRVEPSDLGLPEAREAFLLCSSKSHAPLGEKWPHVALYEVGRRLGWYDLRNGDVTEKAFEKVYRAVCREVFDGQTFKIPMPKANQLEHHGGQKTRTVQQTKAGKQHLAGLKDAFK